MALDSQLLPDSGLGQWDNVTCICQRDSNITETESYKNSKHCSLPYLDAPGDLKIATI